MNAIQTTSDSKARLALLNIVGDLDNPSESALRGIAEIMSDPDVGVRLRAAELLGDHETKDPTVANALEGALSDPDIQVQAAAMLALERTLPNSPAASTAAARLLQSGSVQVRVAAAMALAAQGVEAGRAIIREALRGHNEEPRQIAFNVLSKIPRSVEEYRADIEPLLKSSDISTQKAVAALLVGGSSSDAAIEALGELLKKGKVVAYILRKAAKPAVSAIPALQRAVELGVEPAIPVLCEIAPPDVSLRSLQQALLQNGAGIRVAAAIAVAGLRLATDEMRTRLEKLSHDADAEVRVAARSALVSLSNSPSRTVDVEARQPVTHRD